MYPELKDFPEAELMQAIDRHMSGAFSDTLCFVPHADWHEDTDFSRLVTGIPHPFGNFIWNAHFESETAEQQIYDVLASIKRQNAPSAWIVGPTSKPFDLGQRLLSHDFILISTMPGMAMPLSELRSPPLPIDASISEVADAMEMQEWIQTFSIGYEIPYAVAECFAHWPVHLGFSEQSPVRAFLARQKGIPVACSLLYLSEGLAGIYCVATIPDARRQGLGELVTATPLLAARDIGYRVGVLQASSMGLPIYSKMGFMAYGNIHMYVRERNPEAASDKTGRTAG